MINPYNVRRKVTNICNTRTAKKYFKCFNQIIMAYNMFTKDL